jgi:hypothetical protein
VITRAVSARAAPWRYQPDAPAREYRQNPRWRVGLVWSSSLPARAQPERKPLEQNFRLSRRIFLEEARQLRMISVKRLHRGVFLNALAPRLSRFWLDSWSHHHTPGQGGGRRNGTQGSWTTNLNRPRRFLVLSPGFEGWGKGACRGLLLAERSDASSLLENVIVTSDRSIPGTNGCKPPQSQ